MLTGSHKMLPCCRVFTYMKTRKPEDTNWSLQNKKKLQENCYDFHDSGILGVNEGPDDEKSILLFSLSLW